MNDKIYNWLKEFPGLELLQRQQVDAVPGGCGLFFRGSTVKDRRQNLLGQTQVQKTLHFRLNRYGQTQESAVFFLLLGAWVEDEHALGESATAACKNARCVRDEGGLALWEADLEITCWEDV
jgi:hypothetical protein